MPAPTVPYTPNGPGWPNQSMGPSYGQGLQGQGGMGSMMSMNQVNPGPVAAAGAQPWQGPWLDMQEMSSGAPLDTQAQTWSNSGVSGMGQYLTEDELTQQQPQQPWQGPWLSPDQVQPQYLAHPAQHPQQFGGMGMGMPSSGSWWVKGLVGLAAVGGAIYVGKMFMGKKGRRR